MSETGALLTPSQREYLRGESEKKGASERMAQKRIRERISQTLVEDIQLLQRSIEANTTSLKYEDIIDEVPPDDRKKSLLRALVFISQLAVAGNIDVDDILEDARTEIEEGRKKAIRERLRQDSESVTLGEIMDVVGTEEALQNMEDEIDQIIEGGLGGLDTEEDTNG